MVHFHAPDLSVLVVGMRSVPRVGESVVLEKSAWRVVKVLWDPAAAMDPRIRCYVQREEEGETW